MTPQSLLLSAVLLGAFVLLAGAYALLYCVGLLSGRRELTWASYTCYGLQVAVAFTMLVATPLDWWWKALILASAIVYQRIPPVVWRYLHTLHLSTKERACSRTL